MAKNRRINSPNVNRTNGSPVWYFFTILLSNTRFATCKLCVAIKQLDESSDIITDIPRGGVLQNNWGTTNLRNHLTKNHKTHWDDHLLKLKESKHNGPKINQLFSNKPNKKTNMHNVKTIVDSFPNQPTLPQTVEKNKKWDRNDKRSKSLTQAIAEFLSLAILPFNLVNSYGFKHLIKSAAPNYVLPAPTYFSRTIIPAMYTSVKKHVKQIVDGCTFISFTSDLWTSKYTQDSFIAFTGHCVSATGAVQTVLLACRYFPKRHTSENITEMINAMIDEYDIPKEQIGAIITDNAPNVIKGARDTGHSSFGCILHQMQLVINKAMTTIIGIKSIIDKCRAIVTFVHKSSAAKEQLKLILGSLGSKSRRLVQETPTR